MTTSLATARLLVVEARAARLGLGHWAACSLPVRKANARSNLLLAATYRLTRP